MVIWQQKISKLIVETPQYTHISVHCTVRIKQVWKIGLDYLHVYTTNISQHYLKQGGSEYPTIVTFYFICRYVVYSPA